MSNILYFILDPNKNIFYTQDGTMVANMYEFITPNDLFLFRYDHGYNIFRHRENSLTLCELVIEE